jgi:hypothetical protein
MSKIAREVPNSRRRAPRAAASHLSGDLDRQAPLAVEGFHSGLRASRFDLEAAVCARWNSVMEEDGRGHRYG